MIYNGKDIGNYFIKTSSRSEFIEVLGKLLAIGFVYSSQRLKTVQDVLNTWGCCYCVIEIGTDSKCKMMLHGNAYTNSSRKYIDVDTFLVKYFKAYWEA
jgi:hypothetical protein